MKDTIERIIKLREFIETKMNWQNGQQVAETQAKLALLLAMLGDHRAKLHHQASQTRLSAFKKARERGLSIGDSDVESKEIALKIKEEYETVEFLYKSTATLVDSLRTLVSTIRSEKERT